MLVAVFCIGCRAFQSDDIVSLPSANTLVSNGTMTQRASVFIGIPKAIVVPPNASISTTKIKGVATIEMKKTLSFMGHPAKPMGIKNFRRKAGVAYREVGDEFHFSTFGEYTTPEGGLTMTLHFTIPEGITIRRSDDLSGMQSAATRWLRSQMDETTEQDAKDELWIFLQTES